MTTSLSEEKHDKSCGKNDLCRVLGDDCVHSPAPRVEEKLREEWMRGHWENPWRDLDQDENKAIADWWLEKVAQARQEEQDQIEVRIKEWVKENEKHKHDDIIGAYSIENEDAVIDCSATEASCYNAALSDLLHSLPTIIRNQEGRK